MQAIAEDVGGGDVTTEATIAATARAEAVIVAKAEGVLAGIEVARRVFEQVDAAVTCDALLSDGAHLTPGTTVVRIAGPARGILVGERTALNYLQRLSGVATRTHAFVARLLGTGTQLLDTRKTTPGMRGLEKAAVLAGGGTNHRIGLFDMVLIKDNHIRAAGGLTAAVAKARAEAPSSLLVEVEAQSHAEVEEACAAGVDRILLDNMTTAEVRRALEEIDRASSTATTAADARRRPGARRWPEVEVSGGITLDTVRAYAELGVDYISVGAITHSAPALDLSLEITSLG